MNKIVLSLAIAIICVGAPANAFSAENDESEIKAESDLGPVPASLVGFTSQFEDGGSRTNTLNGRFVFKNGFNIYGSAGASHMVGDRETKTSEQASMGIESDSRRIFSAGISYDYWGLEDIFTNKTTRFPINLNLKDWAFNITPGAGEITITGYVLNRKVERDREDKNISASISYVGLENWSFLVSHEKHDYDFNDSNLALVSNYANLFSETTLAMSSSLIDYRTSIEGTYSFRKFDLGVEVSTSKVTLDKSVQRSSTLLFDYYQGKNWVFSATAGQSKVTDNGRSTTDLENLDPNRYGSLGIKYKFK